MIIVISDVHLGYDACDKYSFNNFIDDKLMKLNENDTLVLLGDILDFWRKSCVDLTINFQKKTEKLPEGIILKKLYNLQKQTNVHYIVGNPDYSILYFNNRVDSFPFSIHRNLHLNVKGNNDKKFYLNHGYEFEVLANYPFMTIEDYESICQHLCDVRQTTIDKIENDFWSALHFQFVGKKLEEHFTIAESIKKPPESRMKELHRFEKESREEKRKPLLQPRNKIEGLAMSPLARSMLIGGKPNETLIFGHTHSPFISEDKMIINSGSWVTDNDSHNTYIEIDNTGDVNLIWYDQ
ncbi:MAG TPA: metallophosphoesterase [Candidatus Nitrosocosmicus sp.]